MELAHNYWKYFIITWQCSFFPFSPLRSFFLSFRHPYFDIFRFLFSFSFGEFMAREIMQKKWTTINSYVISNINQAHWNKRKQTKRTKSKNKNPKLMVFSFSFFPLVALLTCSSSSVPCLPSSKIYNHTQTLTVITTIMVHMDCK